MLSLPPDQQNILMLEEVRELCRAARAKKLGGMSMYANQEHRREAGWMLQGRQDLAVQILHIIGE